MRYLMLVLSTPADPGDTDPVTPIEQWVEKHDGTGARVSGDRLRPQQDAVGVRIRQGRTLITDGPFAESKEAIAGFDVIEAPDLDAALAIAVDHPMACDGAIELRPCWPAEPGE